MTVPSFTAEQILEIGMNGSLASARTQPGADKPVVASTQWRIWVSGYGQFDFDGTEAEAEEMRAHKARWERGNGQKWRADLARESDRLTADIVALWSAREGVPMMMLRKRARARDAERGISPEAVLSGMGRGWVRSRDLAERLGFSRAGVLKALRELRDRGQVQVGGPDWKATTAAETGAVGAEPEAKCAQ